MEYYIYENWTAEKKAVIHKGDCSNCKYGKGKHKEKTDKNGCWHGPFSDFDHAMRNASSMHDRDVRCCKSCAPESDA